MPEKLYHVYHTTEVHTYSKLKVGDVVKPEHKNEFEVRIKFMHGDADGYTWDSLYTEDGKEALNALNFLARCLVAFPNGMGGQDDYSKVQGYEEFEDLIPWDITCCDGSASVETVELFYYNSRGLPHRVEFS